MKKEELIRYKGALAALLVAGGMFLGGCESNAGFEFSISKDNSYVAEENSFINNTYISNCCVVEVFNELTKENNIYMAIKQKNSNDAAAQYNYYNILSGQRLFSENNEENTFIKVINENSLYDYIVALDLAQARYSHEDMQRILEEIKSVYKYESDKELVK